MRFIILCAFVTLAAASRTHQILLLKSENPTTEYREEDSKGFYSYGYSSDDSAKAEYKTSDGSSKGFYSYIDADGKLQTVKYEAGRKQGFTASATNLPTPPMDNNRAPEPVQDTPEVEMAKQAHFEAYREAAIKAAMQPDTGDDGSSNGEEDNGQVEELSNAGDNGANGLSTSEAENGSNGSNGLNGDNSSPVAPVSASAEINLSSEQAAQFETEFQQNNRQLLMNRQNSHNQLLQILKEQQKLASQEIHSGEVLGQQQINQHPQLMTTYVLNAQARLDHPALSELKTVYRLDSSDSNVELKLGGLELELLQQQQQQLNAQAAQLSAEHGVGTIEAIRVPSNSFYSVNSPDTHYTVETPTVLTTLPHLTSISLGHSRLPISLSTAFTSQRLNGKSSH